LLIEDVCMSNQPSEVGGPHSTVLTPRCPRAEIVSIGTELTSGKNLDTNGQWLSVELAKIGVPVHFHTTVGDNLDENIVVFRAAAARCDLVVITGGLGPTQDDLTREALAAVAGVPLEFHQPSFDAIAAMFARRKRPMPDRNRVQALFPAGSEPIPNAHGTAPGIWMRAARSENRGLKIEDGGSRIEQSGSSDAVPGAVRRNPLSSILHPQPSLFIAMPGVPSEMYLMFAEQVRPRLIEAFGLRRVIVHRKINLFGRGESDVESTLLDITERGREPEVGITVHDATISLRIAAAAESEDEARRLIDPTAEIIYERLGPLIFSEGDIELQQMVAELLAARGLTLATAEGCTGGTVAERLVSIPGASRWYRGGVVAYANEAKMEWLGVTREQIEAHGAVSREVAEAMAVACRRRFASDLAVATVGIAGPDGATDDKPIGTTWISVAAADGVTSNCFRVWGDRAAVQSRAAKHALNQVRLWLASPSH
jgi:nicotinamide-nucleotide amidase